MLRKRLLVMLALVFSVLITNAQGSIEIQIGDSVEGKLDDDPIFYTFEAEQGMFLVISLAADEFDPLLNVFDTAFNTLATDADSGEGQNALVRFTVPENGEYLIEVDSEVFGEWGMFNLCLSPGEFISIALGETVEVEFDGETEAFYFAYEGMIGEVITVRAETDGSIDTRLVVFGFTGVELGHDDDRGENNDPLIAAIVLPEDSIYQIHLIPYFNEGVEGVVKLTVEAAVLPNLDHGELQTVDLFETFEAFFSFTAEAGTTYRLTLIAVGGPSSAINISIGGETVASGAFDGGSRSTLEFTATTSDRGLIEIRSFLFDEETLAISLTPVE